MKKARFIFAIICIAISVSISAACIYYWINLWCHDVRSLVAALLFYNSIILGLWFNFDQVIKDSNH